MTGNPASSLLDAVLAGQRAAIGRAITVLENDMPQAPALAAALAGHAGRAHVVGLTGPPGAGKSTLVSAMLGELLARERRVAVVAVDPSSPLTGGAVLGDRVRMGEFGGHENVFIRSLASRGQLGGLSRTTEAVIDLLDAAGFDTVIVETVGAGQSEVAIARLADTSVVVCPPGLGDEVQASKAGILEIADLLVVNKGDLPLAERTMRELEDMLRLRRQRSGWRVPVLRTTATECEGIADLVDALHAHADARGRGRRKATDDADAARLRELHARDACVRQQGIEYVAGGPGTATLRMRVGPSHINFNGTCHGGVIFTLADSAFGLACNSQGVLTAGIDAHLTFQQPVRQGETLRAHAVETSRSKRLCVYRVEVTREDDGASVSTFTGTAFITGHGHPSTQDDGADT